MVSRLAPQQRSEERAKRSVKRDWGAGIWKGEFVPATFPSVCCVHRSNLGVLIRVHKDQKSCGSKSLFTFAIGHVKRANTEQL